MTKHLTANISRLLDTPRSNDWRDRAACRDADETLFYLAGNANGWETAHGREQAAEARAICDTCPLDVALKCRTEALRMSDKDTFRGGMTPQERERWIRQQQRKSRAKVAG